MNLLFFWKRTRLEILNPVTIYNNEMILYVKQSSDLSVLADLSNPFWYISVKESNWKIKMKGSEKEIKFDGHWVFSKFNMVVLETLS